MIAAVSSVVIPDPPLNAKVTRMSLKEKLVALDLGGAVTGITALVLFNFAWNQAPIVSWNEAYVYACLILGVLFACVFFYIELKLVDEPLVPFHVLSGDVSFVLGCVACGWGTFGESYARSGFLDTLEYILKSDIANAHSGIFVYYIWNFLETIRGHSPLSVSAQLSPLAISGACAAIITGFLLSKLRPAVIMTIALCCFLIGVILIGTAPVDQTYWGQTFVCTLIITFGMDMSFPAATLILSNTVDKKHQGVAASLVNTVVNYSISLALGFAGTVEVYTNHGGKTKADQLEGIRHAYYMSFGLAGGGLILSIIFMAKSFGKDRRGPKNDSTSE